MRRKDGLLVGVDEAGVGTLAGPMVMACAAYKSSFEFPPDPMFTDSKKVRHGTRFKGIRRILQTMEWAKVIVFPASVITEMGVWEAWESGIDMILDSCKKDDRVREVIVDGQFRKFRATLALPFRLEAVPDADIDFPCVAAASNLAKDCQVICMDELAETYPEFGFDSHHGYLTSAHKDALERFGRTVEHRTGYGDMMSYPLVKEDRNKHLTSSVEVFDLKGAPTSYPLEASHGEGVRSRQALSRSAGRPARKAAHHGPKSSNVGPHRHRKIVRPGHPAQR